MLAFAAVGGGVGVFLKLINSPNDCVAAVPVRERGIFKLEYVPGAIALAVDVPDVC